GGIYDPSDTDGAAPAVETSRRLYHRLLRRAELPRSRGRYRDRGRRDSAKRVRDARLVPARRREHHGPPAASRDRSANGGEWRDIGGREELHVHHPTEREVSQRRRHGRGGRRVIDSAGARHAWTQRIFLDSEKGAHE